MKKKITEAMAKANKIAISSHVRPDADSIGSGLALYLMLKQLGKDVKFCNTDKAPFPICELPGYPVIEYRQIHPESFDMLVLIEGGTEERTNQKHIENYFTVNIDHHATSSMDANLNWVNPKAAAVGELIYQLGQEMKIQFTRDIGFNLYAAIASDTGSFKYSNTSYESLRIASELVKTCGFQPSEVCDLLFYSNYFEKVQMIQRVLATLELKLNDTVAIIHYKRSFLNSLSLKDIETEDVISIARSIRGVMVTMFLKEIDDSLYRVSIRSKGHVSSQLVAKVFNGGGHDHAAGFFFKGDLRMAKKQVINEIKKQIG